MNEEVVTLRTLVLVGLVQVVDLCVSDKENAEHHGRDPREAVGLEDAVQSPVCDLEVRPDAHQAQHGEAAHNVDRLPEGGTEDEGDAAAVPALGAADVVPH